MTATRKTLLTMAVVVASNFTAFAQGYINTFNAFAPSPGGEIAYLRDCVISGQGPLMPKAIGRVEILSVDGNILSPVKDGTGNRLAVDGLFSLGVMAIPGSIPGQPGQVILRMWDSSTGGTYALAGERAEIIVTFLSLGTPSAPSNFVTGSNFTGLQPYVCCPEPTSVLLTGFGLMVFIGLFRRT